MNSAWDYLSEMDVPLLYGDAAQRKSLLRGSMNAIFVPKRDVYICPVCGGDLHYWVAYDVLLCTKCMDVAYNPDTGKEQGIIT